MFMFDCCCLIVIVLFLFSFLLCVEFVCSCAAATHSCQIELVKTLGSFTSTSMTR